MPEMKKRIRSLYRVVTEDLEDQGFVCFKDDVFIEGGKHFVPYVKTRADDKTLTVDVARRHKLYVLVTFHEIGMPEEINEDADWEDWKMRNRQILLTGDNAALKRGSFSSDNAAAGSAKKMRTLAPNEGENDGMDDNETEEEEEEDEAEAGPVMPRAAPAAAPAAGPVMPQPAPAPVAAAGPQWRDLGPPPDAVRAEAGPVAPAQIKVERQALAAPEQPVMQIVSIVAAPDMVNTEAQAVPLMANAETQHVQVMVSAGIQSAPIMISVGVQTDAQPVAPPAAAPASVARPVAAPDVVDLSMDD